MSLRKNSGTLLAIASVLYGSAALANDSKDQDDRYYLAVNGGIHDLDSWDARVNLGAGIEFPADTELEGGAVVSVVLGKDKGDHRYELEYHYGMFELQGVSLASFTESTQADGDYMALTINAYRIKQFDHDWSLLAGVGVGLGRVKLPQVPLSNGCNCFARSSSTGFVWQARIGAEYELSEEQFLHLNYTWLHFDGPSGGDSPSITYADKTIGSLMLGYRHRF